MAKLPDTVRKTFTTYKDVWQELREIAVMNPEDFPYGVSGIIRQALQEWLNKYKEAHSEAADTSEAE